MDQPVETLLAEMDEAGVEKAIICAIGSHLVINNEEGNDFISGVVKKHPDRFLGFASVNPWYGEKAVEELKRSITGLGLSGLKLHPVLQGFQANEKIVFPVIEEAIRLGVWIYIHSGTPVCSLPLQILELAQKYPEAKFIMGHMGGADFFLDVPEPCAKVSNVYLETSLTCHPVFVKEAIEKLGSERVMFGSDSPTSDMKTEIEKIKVLNLSDKELNNVLWRNAHRLFGL
ncbi:MAG: amidohydrolase [Firmicutes bacterium]|nr:amidohydrolase [Bacillota bacterium]